MVKESSYFIVSGFISITLFIFVIFLFFYMLFSATKVNNFALNKDNFISVSLDLVSLPTKQVQPKKETIALKEEIVTPQEPKEVDIGNLFSDVWTKDIKITKKQEKRVDNKRLEKIQKQLKTSKKNQVESFEENLKNYEAIETDTTAKKSSSANEVNEYLAKIQAIVYKYFMPPANSEGYTVQAVIELSAIGKVQDFRILRYSTNSALNEECKKIKGRLLGVLFPKNPEGVSSKTIVNITSDKN